MLRMFVLAILSAPGVLGKSLSLFFLNIFYFILCHYIIHFIPVASNPKHNSWMKAKFCGRST